MLEHLTTFIIHLITDWGHVGVFVLMFLESMLLPIPSEVTMAFGGFWASKGLLSLPVVILMGALGNLGGSLVAYAIGYYLEETVIVGWIEKYGKYFFINIHDYHKAMVWVKKYGISITFFSRLLPVVRTFISLPAGLSEMNIWKFSFYTFLGSLIWSAFLAYLGFYLGAQWESIDQYFKQFQIVIILLILLGIGWYLKKKLLKKKTS